MFVPSWHPWTDPRSGGSASNPERYALLAGADGAYLGLSDGTNMGHLKLITPLR